jgi:DNA polymerase III subunit delta'
MTDLSAPLNGHEDAIRQITEAYASGRMHHAWLLTGADGIGKTSLAQRIAAYVLSGGTCSITNPDPRNPAAKLIVADAHPDLLIVRRTENDSGELRKGIVVEDVLKIAEFMHMTSAHGGWRIVIVDEAHTLNRNSQNAILKVLEEPADRTLILMTATTAGAMLPTIRSRCRVLPLAPLDDKHMRAILARAAPDISPDDIKNLIALSGGSAGFALKIIHAEVLPLYAELQSVLGDMPALDVARLHKLADQIARKADAESYEVLTTLLIDRLHNDVRGLAVVDSKSPMLDRKLQVWDKVRATFASTEGANLDRRLAFINAISDIRAAMA